jgi:hypothetical protein
MEAIFLQLLEHCRQRPSKSQPYDWVDLLQLILDYSVSEAGRDSFLRYILTSAVGGVGRWDSPADGVLSLLADFKTWSESRKDEAGVRLQEVADNLLNHFFIHCKRRPSIRTRQLCGNTNEGPS